MFSANGFRWIILSTCCWMSEMTGIVFLECFLRHLDFFFISNNQQWIWQKITLKREINVLIFFFQNVLLTITASTATESIQFDGRAVSLGSGTSLHVPSSPAQAPSTTTPTDINLNLLRSPSPASENSSPAPSNTQIGTISPSTTDKRSTSDGQDGKSITQLLQQSAQQLLKSQLDMPPPTSPTAPSPRKRRRKRDDPQSCHTNSEVSCHHQIALIR